MSWSRLSSLKKLGPQLHTLLLSGPQVGKRWLRELPEHGVTVTAAVDLHPRKLGKRIHEARDISPDELDACWRPLPDP